MISDETIDDGKVIIRAAIRAMEEHTMIPDDAKPHIRATAFPTSMAIGILAAVTPLIESRARLALLEELREEFQGWSDTVDAREDYGNVYIEQGVGECIDIIDRRIAAETKGEDHGERS